MLVRHVNSRDTPFRKQVIYLPARLRRIRYGKSVFLPIRSNFVSRFFSADTIYFYRRIISVIVIKPLYDRKFFLAVGTFRVKNTKTATLPSRSEAATRVLSFKETVKSGSLSQDGFLPHRMANRHEYTTADIASYKVQKLTNDKHETFF